MHPVTHEKKTKITKNTMIRKDWNRDIHKNHEEKLQEK